MHLFHITFVQLSYLFNCGISSTQPVAIMWNVSAKHGRDGMVQAIIRIQDSRRKGRQPNILYISEKSHDIEDIWSMRDARHIPQMRHCCVSLSPTIACMWVIMWLKKAQLQCLSPRDQEVSNWRWIWEVNCMRVMKHKSKDSPWLWKIGQTKQGFQRLPQNDL